MEAIKELIQNYNHDINFWKEFIQSKIKYLKKLQTELHELEDHKKHKTLDITHNDYEHEWFALKVKINTSKAAITWNEGKIATYEKVIADLNKLIENN